MKSLLKTLGFPAEENENIVRFYFAKNLSYKNRMLLAVSALVSGFIIQFVFLNAWLGLPFLLAAVTLTLVKGFDSRARLKYFSLDANWTKVSMAKIQELEMLRKRNLRWDRDFLDISNPLGMFSFLFFFGGGLLLAQGLGDFVRAPRVAQIFKVDLIALFVPYWLTGMKFILKQPNLAIKIRIIKRLNWAFDEFKVSGETFQPELKLARNKDNQTIPVDARFTVSFPNQPDYFFGVQSQININLVQGKSYPYFYCVLVTKAEFDLEKYKNRISLPDKVICEYQEDQGVKVLVIRQRTTKKTGYYTRISICNAMLRSAVLGARAILSAAVRDE